MSTYNEHPFECAMPRLAHKDLTIPIILYHKIENTFLRIDAYPAVFPKHMERHFGWIDIPLSEFDCGKNKLFYDGNHISINGKEYAFNLNFHEEGECIWHFSLWRNEQMLPYPVISKRFYYFNGNPRTIFKHANVTISELCNLKCTMCARERMDSWINNPSRYLMTPEEAVLFAEKYSTLKSIILLGNGEPLLNPDLFEIIAAFRNRLGDNVELTSGSNATLLTREKADRLAYSGLNGFGFSVDGATAKTYEAIRIGGKFQEVCTNIAYFVDYTRKNNIPMYFWINFCVQPSNIGECKDFIQLCADIGLEDVRFSLLQDYNIGTNLSLHDSLLRTWKRPDIENILIQTRIETLDFANKKNISCIFDNVSNDIFNINDKEKFCPFVEWLSLGRGNYEHDDFCCNSQFRPNKQDKYAIDPYEDLRILMMQGHFPMYAKIAT